MKLQIHGLLIFVFLGLASASEEECSPGETNINGQCFRFYNENVTFEDARKLCENNGYDLASVCNIFINNFILLEAERALGMTYGHFWTGYTRKYTDQWEWTGVSCSGSYTNWQSGFPFSTDNCSAMSVPNGKWRSFHCYEELPFVCSRPAGGQLPTVTSTTVVTQRPSTVFTTTVTNVPSTVTTTEPTTTISTVPTTTEMSTTPEPTTSLVPACEHFDWNTGKCYDGWMKVGGLNYETGETKLCKAINKGSLVSIHNIEELNFVISLFEMRNDDIEEQQLVWTGLRGTPTVQTSWKWSDGTVVDFFPNFVRLDNCTVDCCFVMSPGRYNYSGISLKAGNFATTFCDSVFKQAACKYEAIWV